LQNPFSGSSKKWKGLTFATSLLALSAVVLAWNVTWNAPVSLVVESIDLKVYLEQNCTTPATTIDFGNIETDGTNYYKYMWVRNEGLGPVTLHWNSTLASETDQISDYWEYNSGIGYIPMDSHTIGADVVLQTRYRVYVNPTVDPGSYSWTLYLGAEQ